MRTKTKPQISEDDSVTVNLIVPKFIDDAYRQAAKKRLTSKSSVMREVLLEALQKSTVVKQAA